MWKTIAKVTGYACCIAGIVVVYLGYAFLHTKLNITNEYELTINRGDTIWQIAQQLEDQRIIKSARLLRYLAWYRGDARQIKAGEYRLLANFTPQDFLATIVAGRVIQYSFTIIEGWRLEQVVAALKQEPKINAKLAGINTVQLIDELAKLKIRNLEGQLWPDTYFYTAGTTDVEFLLRAHRLMQIKLQQAWQDRQANLALKDPYTALILASIIEKETSVPSEYGKISGVFQLRLKQNMLLQADPTVLYALYQQENFKLPISK